MLSMSPLCTRGVSKQKLLGPSRAFEHFKLVEPLKTRTNFFMMFLHFKKRKKKNPAFLMIVYKSLWTATR